MEMEIVKNTYRRVFCRWAGCHLSLTVISDKMPAGEWQYLTQHRYSCEGVDRHSLNPSQRLRWQGTFTDCHWGLTKFLWHYWPHFGCSICFFLLLVQDSISAAVWPSHTLLICSTIVDRFPNFLLDSSRAVVFFVLPCWWKHPSVSCEHDGSRTLQGITSNSVQMFSLTRMTWWHFSFQVCLQGFFSNFDQLSLGQMSRPQGPYESGRQKCI